MNIGEATDTNSLLRYVLGIQSGAAGTPTDDEAMAAAMRLADRADKAVHAGLTGDRVAAAWSRVEVCPEGSDDHDSD